MTPVLLLVSGMLNDDSVWDAVADRLRRHAQVRIISPVQASITQMAAAAWDQVADVSASTPLVLAGFSMGGYVAIEMLAHPRRPLAAAALISTNARVETPEGAVNREKTIAAIGKDFARVVNGIVQWTTHAPSPAVAQSLTEMMLRVGPDVAIRQNRAIAGRADHNGALAKLQLPVAVLCGEHDRTTTPELAQELADTIAGASLTLVSGAGHMLPCERPDAVAAALLALLALLG